jgi:hypothetical protein
MLNINKYNGQGIKGTLYKDHLPLQHQSQSRTFLANDHYN